MEEQKKKILKYRIIESSSEDNDNPLYELQKGIYYILFYLSFYLKNIFKYADKFIQIIKKAYKYLHQK